MQALGLRAECRDNPLGVEVQRPRLSWRLKSDRIGARQTAYRARVAASLDALERGGAGACAARAPRLCARPHFDELGLGSRQGVPAGRDHPAQCDGAGAPAAELGRHAELVSGNARSEPTIDAGDLELSVELSAGRHALPLTL